MSITLENKQCLMAGDGLLPVKMAQAAKENGFEVIAISLSDEIGRASGRERVFRAV